METTGAPRPHIPSLVEHALAALAYLGLSLFYLRPIWRLFGDHIGPDTGDPWFNLTVIKWGMHQIRLGMPDFWNLPFFFPARGVTAYSDNLLGPAALGTLLTTLFPGMSAVAVYNLFFLSSFVLCGWSTWYVLRRSGTGVAAAFLGGCVFAFSSYRWDQTSHLQMLLMGWIPLTLWTWDRLLEAPSWRRAVVFFLFFFLHGTGGSYLAYMILFPMAVLLAVRAPGLLQRERLRSVLRVLVPTGVASALLLGALFLPYVRGSGSRARSNLEIQVYGASLVSYFTPTGHMVLTGEWADDWRRNENSLFAGILPTLLVGAAAVHGWRTRRQTPIRPLSRAQKVTLAILAVLALDGMVRGEIATWSLFGVEQYPPHGFNYGLSAAALSLGLVALGLRRWWGGNWPLRLTGLSPWERGVLFSGILTFFLTFPVVYEPLMRRIPGLSGMRVSARFYTFVSFAIAWFAARELDRLLRRVGSPILRPAAAVALAAFLLIDLAPSRLEWFSSPPEGDYPPVYHWLARQKGVAGVLELPMTDDSTDINYMVYATLHWKPLVNGFSGYLPDVYTRFR
ncbi:MAG TPA: hypothetical protein VEW48_00140, partial [Thermoanaerobaculia bacterium]|nr:hypothetical protein [Thermoanaerobaculia bacterium]